MRHGALVVVGVIVFALGLWLFIKLVPEQLASTNGITDPSERGQEIGRVRTAVLASLAGILAAIGAYYTHRSFGLNRETLELSRQGQITERFTRAVDQIGNDDSIDVRLGGIYALERLARESRADHGPIMEILTAFVREHTRRSPQDADDNLAAEIIATDIQAVLTVLGRRTVAHDPLARLNLGGAHVEGANLEGAHLELADLAGAHLEAANLVHAYLEGADLAGAHLEGANLDGAHLEGPFLSGAHFERAFLGDANLEGAFLGGAHLEGTYLRGAHLEGSSYVKQGMGAGAVVTRTRSSGGGVAGAARMW